jgi:hypothetical protein
MRELPIIFSAVLGALLGGPIGFAIGFAIVWFFQAKAARNENEQLKAELDELRRKNQE